jgi:cytochrome c-type biogenesis protein CcmH/NrfF
VRFVLLGALALALAGPAFASEQHPTQSELEAELVCPQCKEPLDESSSPIAQQMKAYIRQHIAMGWTKSRIVDSLVGPPNNLGPSVLGVPRKHGFDLLAWLLPLAGIAAGALALAGGAWAWSRNRGPGDVLAPDGPPLDPALARRVDEELARYDA